MIRRRIREQVSRSDYVCASPLCILHELNSYAFILARNEVVGYLAGLDEMTSHLTTRVPMQVLTDIDNGRNPMHLTKDRLERAATENQFMNGKIKAIEVCLGFAHVSDPLMSIGVGA